MTIAVDSYGPVTDNAQSVYELSLIEQVPNVAEGTQERIQHRRQLRARQAPARRERRRRQHVQSDGQTCADRHGRGRRDDHDFLDHHGADQWTDHQHRTSCRCCTLRLYLGLITGGAIIYWFTGASTQAVTTGAYRAVEFIKANIKLEGVEKASVEDSKKVVEICTQVRAERHVQYFHGRVLLDAGFRFCRAVLLYRLLISIAIFGLYQAIFMANAGGAWDNAKKIVEVDLKQKGTPLHDATVIGDTVGDPFKDTSSVAMNPVIKFTTLFGLLAVELAVTLATIKARGLTRVLALVFFLVSFAFVYRSFYGMRIKQGAE